MLFVISPFDINSMPSQPPIDILTETNANIKALRVLFGLEKGGPSTVDISRGNCFIVIKVCQMILSSRSDIFMLKSMVAKETSSV